MKRKRLSVEQIVATLTVHVGVLGYARRRLSRLALSLL